MKSTLFGLLLFCFGFDAVCLGTEEQILEVSTVNGIVLSDPIVGLTQNGFLYLPILDMGKILGVRMEQPAIGQFKVFRSESDFQSLDLNHCPRPQTPKECTSALESHGIFYLQMDYLKEGLGWPIAADLKAMRVTMDVGNHPKELFVREGIPEKPVLLSRRQFGYPSARVETTLASDNTRNNLNLYESQAFLEQDSDIQYSKNGSDSVLRWTLSQEVVEKSESNEVKSYEILSTQTLDTKYLFSPTQITGVNFSNIRRNETIFDTQNLYEKGPPRWKVELYVNEIYLGETFVDANGNFSFLNIPVFYGSNKIHYRLTSPLGQVVELDKYYSVSSEFEGKGKLKYQAAFGQKVNDSSYVGSGFVNYGLATNWSGQAGYAAFEMPDASEKKQYVFSGLSFLQPQYSLSASHLSSTGNKENAWVFSPKFGTGRVFITSEYAQFQSFRSQLINLTADDKLQALKKITAISTLPFEHPVTGQLSFQEANYQNISSSQQLQARLFTMYSQSSFLVESNKFWPSTASPDLYVEHGRYSSALRARYGILIQDDRYAKSKIELESLLPKDYFLNASVEVPIRLSDRSYAIGLSKIIGDIQLEANVIESSAHPTFTLTLSSNIKSSPSGYKLSQAENYRQASIEIFAFVDENGNGKFDAGEKPYPRLRILHGQRQKEYETNIEGLAQIAALNPYETISLEIVRESISNIFLTAEDFHTDYALTPAEHLRIEVPMKASFDVRGTIVNSYFKKLVPLELLDSENKVIAVTSTTASGRYKFPDLTGGTYFVRVEKNFLQRNSLHSVPEIVAVEALGKPGVRSALEMILEKQ